MISPLKCSAHLDIKTKLPSSHQGFTLHSKALPTTSSVCRAYTRPSGPALKQATPRAGCTNQYTCFRCLLNMPPAYLLCRQCCCMLLSGLHSLLSCCSGASLFPGTVGLLRRVLLGDPWCPCCWSVGAAATCGSASEKTSWVPIMGTKGWPLCNTNICSTRQE